MKMNRKNPYGDIGRENYWQTVRRRFLHHRLACISLVVLAVICAAAILEPVIAPYDPDAIAGPFGAPPGAGFLLGTDQIGRDMFSRLLYATRISLLVGVLATAISTAIGVSLGLLGGYFGGWLDIAIMRFTDMVMSFPYILLVLVAAAIFEPGLWSIILILGFVDWPGIARLVRGQILSLREQEFMTATEACGISVSRRIFRHLIPNVIPQLIVNCTMSLGSTIITEATLSFLGLGVKFPFASWGNIMNDVSNSYVLTEYWFIWIPAGICLMLTVLGFNFVGDGLRDAFDPKMKR